MAIDLFIGDRPRQGQPILELDSPSLRSRNGRRYELKERLASGGNGVVFTCVASSSGEEFAVKFQLLTGGTRTERFKREVGLLRSLKHKHLVGYEGDGTIRAWERATTRRSQWRMVPFVIMELAERNLARLVEEHRGTLGYETYVAQFRGLANALAEIHKRAIHRDIKPENILVAGERWVLSDFGLCSLLESRGGPDLTRVEERLGPRYWMSPEAVNRVMGNSDLVHTASDVFQIASVFWFVVTGRHPSGVVQWNDWRGPKELFEVLHRCLSHDPKLRPKDGGELVIALDAAVRQRAGL